MLSGNGTIDYNVEAHTLDAKKRLPLRVKGPPQETYMVALPKTFMVAPHIDINTEHLDSKPVSILQARIANLERQIESLDMKLMRLEENFDSEENDESYERTLSEEDA